MMEIFVPKFKKENGLTFIYEKLFSIKCLYEKGTVTIESDKAGLIYIARVLLQLAQDDASPIDNKYFQHIHFDEESFLLEKGSIPLIFVRK